MALQAAILGASGYTGGELLRLLAGHPSLAVTTATAEANAGAPVPALHPGLAAAYPDTVLTALDPAALAGVDVVFCALPHGTSQEVVPELVGSVGHVVDLGADFRTGASDYERWYGESHRVPDLLDDFAYGLPELFRDEIVGADHVAVPGCYPTAAALALAPLLAHGRVEPAGIVVDAASGVSGRGRGLSTPSLFSEADADVRAYALCDHRHTGEIEATLRHVARTDVSLLFTPHLVPTTRGLLATCYARPAGSSDRLSTEALLAEYRDHYAGEPFVLVTDEPPGTKATLGSNALHVTVRHDRRTDTVLAVAAEDNLVKGAAGQALQCANLLLGLPETTGLSPLGISP